MSNQVCELLGIKYPIFQGAMAHISESNLASSVSNAGGLGIIAAGNAPADFVLEQIRLTKQKTDRPFGVNIMLLSPFADDIAKICCDERVAVVTTGAGNPAKYIEMFKENKIKIIPVIPSVAIAKKMEKYGADAVVAEGMEAGGHIGKLTTMALLPQVVDSVSIPVIGAGGIGDGRGMAAVFMLGGQGVQIGTRFLTAQECIVHQFYKEAILKAGDISTTITSQITGHPVRVLRNKLSQEYDKIEKEEMRKDKPDLERLDILGRGALRKAVVEGDISYGSVMAGQIAGLVKKEQTCEEIINEVMSEFNHLVK